MKTLIAVKKKGFNSLYHIQQEEEPTPKNQGSHPLLHTMQHKVKKKPTPKNQALTFAVTHNAAQGKKEPTPNNPALTFAVTHNVAPGKIEKNYPCPPNNGGARDWMKPNHISTSTQL
jgi:hypothetical protein